MKFKQTVLLATFVVTMGLLLGTSAAQAAEVTFGTVITDKAIGITNLDIGGTFYNVLFDEQTPAVGVYGALPGDFDFTTDVSAEAAANAVNAALNGANAQLVGEDTPLDNPLSLSFNVGYGSAVTPPLLLLRSFGKADSLEGDGATHPDQVQINSSIMATSAPMPPSPWPVCPIRSALAVPSPALKATASSCKTTAVTI